MFVDPAVPLNRVAVVTAGTLELMLVQVTRSPMSAALALVGFDFLLGPSFELVYCNGVDSNLSESCDDQAASFGRFLELFSKTFLPNRVLHCRPSGVGEEAFPDVIRPLIAGKRAVDDRPTLYVCSRGECQSPIVGSIAIRVWIAAHAAVLA